MPNTRIYWLHALSPTHAGIGRGVGYIDLPIDRDGVTGWPIIRGSAFKGVWADHHRATTDARRSDATLCAAFGIAGDDNNSNAGALIPTDATLVCLPVRSFRGTFAWCTSPLCLQMLRRTLRTGGREASFQPPPQDWLTTRPITQPVRRSSKGSRFSSKTSISSHKNVRPPGPGRRRSQPGCFPATPPGKSSSRSDSLCLPDTAFDFLCETGTEVHTRVRINDDTKTVAEGALWTEESLPAETILAGIVQCDRVFGRNGEDVTPKGLLDRFAKDALTLQIGGKATVGRGQMRCVFTPVNGGGQ